MAQQNTSNEQEKATALGYMIDDVMKGMEPLQAYKKETKERESLFSEGFESVKQKSKDTKSKFCPPDPESVEQIVQWMEDNPIHKLNYWGNASREIGLDDVANWVAEI